MLGHADPSITLRIYAHAMPNSHEHVAAVMGKLLRRRPDVRALAGVTSVGGLPYVATVMKPGCINEPRLSVSPRYKKYDGGG